MNEFMAGKFTMRNYFNRLSADSLNTLILREKLTHQIAEQTALVKTTENRSNLFLLGFILSFCAVIGLLLNRYFRSNKHKKE